MIKFNNLFVIRNQRAPSLIVIEEAHAVLIADDRYFLR